MTYSLPAYAANYYGVQNPNPNPNAPQMRTPRRRPVTGTVDIHTAESIIDLIAPDTGAENVAHYISNRTSYGSYHCIVDSDSIVHYAPPWYETWSVAADGGLHNWQGWGLCFATQRAKWGQHPHWDMAAIDNAGKAIAAFARWCEDNHGIATEAVARRITPDQARSGEPGIVAHGELQPYDRTDPWVNLPIAPTLWGKLLTATKNHLGEDDMNADQDRMLREIYGKVAPWSSQINNIDQNAAHAPDANKNAQIAAIQTGPARLEHRLVKLEKGMAAILDHLGISDED